MKLKMLSLVAVGAIVSAGGAQAATMSCTTSGSGEINSPYFDDSVQHPILDDNEDGQGSNALSEAQGDDGNNSKLLYIGTSPPATNEPGDVIVTKVCDPRFLGITEDAVDLWAEVSTVQDLRRHSTRHCQNPP